MTTAPKEWSSAMLGDVCQVTSGGTPKTAVAANWGGPITWITPDDLSKDRSQTVLRGERSLTQDGYDACSARLFPRGSVVVSSRAPIGYVAIAGTAMCTNQGCKTATPPEFIDPKYLYWYMINAKEDLESRASGTTFKEISGRGFAETVLCWPALDEQRRIVAIVEDHLSRLDAAAQESLVACRRIDSWRASTADSVLWAPGWPTRRVGELLREPMRNGRSDRAVKEGESGTRTLTLTAVTRNAFVDANTKMTVTTPAVASDLWLEPGDIFVQRANTPDLVGTTARFDGPKDWAIFPDLLIRLRADERVIDGRFLTAVLRSERSHRALRVRAKGLAGSMPKVDQGAVAEVDVPVPSLSEQRRALGRLDAVNSGAEAMTPVLCRQMARVKALGSALLSAAFSGRLTAGGADPDGTEEMTQ